MVLFVVGCDLDRDGLGDYNEHTFGSAPLKADTDGDGLSDGDEVFEYRTDPAASDSDGDGTSDGEEVNFGFDPLDRDSRPYEKGWPATPAVEKDSIPEAPSEMVVGLPILRTWLTGRDGEVVDLYDYAFHGKPVILICGNAGSVESEIRGVWQETSSTFEEWISGHVLAGDVLFAGVATMSQQLAARPPELVDIKRCEDEHFGCFADTSWDLFRHIGNEEIYTAILLDEEMVVLATSSYENQVPLEPAIAAALGVPPPE
jgi:hypothetical protein